jgi:glycine cleavage system H protein
VELPKNLRYSEYVWAKADGNTATLGVTDYGLKQTKEIVFIDLPKKGLKLKKGDTFVSLESVKWSGHVASPVSGEVTDVNTALFDAPETLNKDPYGMWVCKVRLQNPDELKQLMDSKKALEWVKENL